MLKTPWLVMEEPTNKLSFAFHKAGLQSVDFKSLQQKIEDLSKVDTAACRPHRQGSKFYEREREREQTWLARVENLRPKYDALRQDAPLYAQLEKLVDSQLHGMSAAATCERTFVHVDMDAFYAAVEMRDDPSLRERPMAVGGMSMLSTANYHARKFGISSAMPGYIALVHSAIVTDKSRSCVLNWSSFLFILKSTERPASKHKPSLPNTTPTLAQ